MNQITAQIPQIADYKVGILHLFVQHTSCALSLNENWDEDVRADMSDALDRIAPEDDGSKSGSGSKGLYRHSAEGRDDMPVWSLFFVSLCNSSPLFFSISCLLSPGRLFSGGEKGWEEELPRGKQLSGKRRARS